MGFWAVEDIRADIVTNRCTGLTPSRENRLKSKRDHLGQSEAQAEEEIRVLSAVGCDSTVTCRMGGTLGDEALTVQFTGHQHN